jgi:mRNA interferase RelE/StbE
VSGRLFTLVIAPTARRQLAEQLPESVAFAAYEFIVGRLLENPYRVGKQLRPPLDDRHSARRGTYCVLYRIDDAAHCVTVVGSSGAPPPTEPAEAEFRGRIRCRARAVQLAIQFVG